MAEDRMHEIFSRRGQFPEPRPDQPSDPVLTEMVRLQALPARERDHALEPYLEKWIAQNLDRYAIAEYLATAGLTLEEAVALEEVVFTRATDHMRRQARKETLIGLTMAALSVGILLLGTLMARPFPGWSIMVMATFLASVMAFLRAAHIMRRIATIPDDEIDR